MDSMKTLSQYFGNTCEIFSRMPTNLIPWNDFFNLSDMDYDFINQYGSRYACSYLNKIDYSINANKDKLSADIIRFHYHKWKHLWLAYTSEYNPTDNTFLTETVTREVEKGDNGTVTREVETGDSGTVTNNLARGETGTVKNDINTSNVSTQTGKKTTTTDNDVYGFNGGAVNDTAGTTNETIDNSNPLKTSETQSGYTQDTFNKHYTDTGTVTNSNTGTESESVTNSNTGTESETVTTERAGSIGVMTPATMLKIERETWQWNYFRDVMNDVADFISLQIFD